MDTVTTPSSPPRPVRPPRTARDILHGFVKGLLICSTMCGLMIAVYDVYMHVRQARQQAVTRAAKADDVVLIAQIKAATDPERLRNYALKTADREALRYDVADEFRTQLQGVVHIVLLGIAGTAASACYVLVAVRRVERRAAAGP